MLTISLVIPLCELVSFQFELLSLYHYNDSKLYTLPATGRYLTAYSIYSKLPAKPCKNIDVAKNESRTVRAGHAFFPGQSRGSYGVSKTRFKLRAQRPAVAAVPTTKPIMLELSCCTSATPCGSHKPSCSQTVSHGISCLPL